MTGGPRLAKMWLILDLARKRCLDSENQDTIELYVTVSDEDIYILNGNNSLGA